MEKYLISGGSGYIGRALCAHLLARGHEVTLLSTKNRNIPFEIRGVKVVNWQPAQSRIDTTWQDGTMRLVNLAGAGIADKRWTTARKQELLESRIQALRTLHMAATRGQFHPTQVVSISASGYYGAATEQVTEDSLAGHDFLASVCKAWEQEANTFHSFQIPVSILRSGIVLGRDSPFLKNISQTFPFRVAFYPGNGRQWLSWIHVDDLTKLFMHVMDTLHDGVLNAVAPEVVTLKTMMQQWISLQQRPPVLLPFPYILLRSILGEIAEESIKSLYVTSNRMQEEGIQFTYPELNAALQASLSASR